MVMILILLGVVCRCKIKPSTTHAQHWSTFLDWTVYVLATCTQDLNLHRTSIGLKCHLQCRLQLVQAQVYDILPPTTAILDYAVGLDKHQLTVFHWCSNGSTFVTDKSNYIKRFFYI